MNPTITLLARLNGVQQCSKDRWRAICPAHDSKRGTRSLSVRELPDGTLLIHCFGGCEVGDIAAAAGFQLRDLFPANHCAPHEPRHPQRPNHWHSSREALQTLSTEGFLVLVAAENVAGGTVLQKVDLERLAVAVDRLRSAARACL